MTGGSLARGAPHLEAGSEVSHLDRAALGDREAFDLLIRPRLDRLYRMAYAITRSEPDAFDATQDACVLAWRELPRLRDRAKFDAWLSQILVNAARGVVRRTGRVRKRELWAAPDVPETGTRSEPYVLPEADTLGDSEIIQRAFARLDGTKRSLLILHYVEGAPLGDIARAVGAPLGTIKWRLSNARKALERALEVERR